VYLPEADQINTDHAVPGSSSVVGGNSGPDTGSENCNLVPPDALVC